MVIVVNCSPQDIAAEGEVVLIRIPIDSWGGIHEWGHNL